MAEGLPDGVGEWCKREGRRGGEGWWTTIERNEILGKFWPIDGRWGLIELIKGANETLSASTRARLKIRAPVSGVAGR